MKDATLPKPSHSEGQQGSQHEHRTYTFIASDYKPKPGGIAAYLDSLARGLINVGASVRVLAVIPAEDHARLTYLERYEAWVLPFPVTHDERPRNWVGYGVISVLEMLTMRALRNRAPSC